ncbi:MAG: hypothetical protein FWB72_00990 [Firmicutes bacterium]|nr:hypothetical protein [Bacillota bacterium]
MSIIKMKKMTAVGLLSDRDVILNEIERLQCIDISNLDGVERTKFDADSGFVYQTKLERVTQAIKFANEYYSILKKKKQNTYGAEAVIEGGSLDISHDKFLSFYENEQIFVEAEKLLEIAGKTTLAKREYDSLLNKRNDARFFNNFSNKFSEMRLSAATVKFLGTVKTKAVDSIIKEIGESEEYSSLGILFEVVGGAKKTSGVLAVAAVEHKEKLEALLHTYDFKPTMLKDDKTGVELLNYIDTKVAALEKEIFDGQTQVMQIYAKSGTDFKIAHDSLLSALARLDATQSSLKTRTAFAFTAWVPETHQDDVKTALEKACTRIEVGFDEASEEETPPTYLKNPKLVKPFESVANMYSPPSHKQTNPTLFVGVWFWILFGAMLGDLGYGLILFVGLGPYLLIKKPQGGFAAVLRVLAMCGLAAIFWGLAFGSFFGVPPQYLGGFGDFLTTVSFIDPLSDAVDMMMLCIIIACLHLGTSNIFGLAERAREGNLLEGIIKNGSWMLILFGLFFVLIGQEEFMGAELFMTGIAALTTLGLVFIVGGTVLLLANGYQSRSIFGKVFGGLGGLYGYVNHLSDVLSYLRVLGLALSTGVFGLVFFSLAQMFADAGGAAIIGSVLVLIVGHTFSLALALLSTYIQTLRLQFVESFPRFYEGGGRLFVPFGGQHKYVKVN